MQRRHGNRNFLQFFYTALILVDEYISDISTLENTTSSYGINSSQSLRQCGEADQRGCRLKAIHEQLSAAFFKMEAAGSSSFFFPASTFMLAIFMARGERS